MFGPIDGKSPEVGLPRVRNAVLGWESGGERLKWILVGAFISSLISASFFVGAELLLRTGGFGGGTAGVQLASATTIGESSAGQTSQAPLNLGQGDQLQRAPAARALLVATEVVPRNSSRGVHFAVAATGTYEFRYISGSYSTYASRRSPAGSGTWIASVCVFEGSPVWHGNILSTSDAMLVLGWGGKYFMNQTDAANAAAGQAFDSELIVGSQVTLVTVDAQDAYADNSGSDVTIEIWLLP